MTSRPDRHRGVLSERLNQSYGNGADALPTFVAFVREL
jgi:hypothetical protein